MNFWRDIGLVYKCNICLKPIFVKYKVAKYSPAPPLIYFYEYKIINKPIESYDYDYLPDNVRLDFIEAALCYSAGCYNAFAAMCRRTIQSSCMASGI